MDEPLEVVKLHAENGSIKNQIKMGDFYLSSTSKDYFSAAYWYKLAFEQNNSVAKEQYKECERQVLLEAEKSDAKYLKNIAICFKVGSSLMQSYKKAYFWLEKAMQAGEISAVFEIADFHRFGFYVTKDVTQYYLTILPYIAKDNYKAMNCLAICYLEGFGLEKNYKMAMDIIISQAEKGYAVSQNSLGCCYDYGDSMPLNYSEAFKWFMFAALQGEHNSQKNVGVYYKYGKAVTKNIDEAKRWLFLSSEQGNATAQYELADLYEKEKGFYHAFKLYTASANQENSSAQFKLAKMYQNGIWVQKDIEKSKKLYTASSCNGNLEAEEILKTIN